MCTIAAEALICLDVACSKVHCWGKKTTFLPVVKHKTFEWNKSEWESSESN